MPTAHQTYAKHLCVEILRRHEHLQAHTDDECKIIAHKNNGEVVYLDLTPFEAKPQSADAAQFFEAVKTLPGLISAYHQARQKLQFEEDLPDAQRHVHDYAQVFLNQLLMRAKQTHTDAQARLIAAWVKNLDIYVAVKAVESLLNSKADMALLELAAKKNWTVHFDHLAIRCGHAGRGDAERVVQLLRDEHGYCTAQVEGENYYPFSDGWNAYPLYKILNNGQVLRLFIDQSDADHPRQIIQHWNRVYGYTAHHLGLRASQFVEGVRVAISLTEMMAALAQENIPALTPTGDYTQGMLLQVFTKPERNMHIPADLTEELRNKGSGLELTVENAKLLELVSREEVPPRYAQQYFQLYDLHYQAENPLHSVPAYQFFLPAQAAHVINTSVQLS